MTKSIVISLAHQWILAQKVKGQGHRIIRRSSGWRQLCTLSGAQPLDAVTFRRKCGYNNNYIRYTFDYHVYYYS